MLNSCHCQIDFTNYLLVNMVEYLVQCVYSKIANIGDLKVQVMQD